MTAPQSPAATPPAAGPNHRPRALSVIPVFGPCAVCGVDAVKVVVFAGCRRVLHRDSRWPACVLPNPERGE